MLRRSLGGEATGKGLLKVWSIVLKRLSDNLHLTYELATIVIEIESTLNNRPLTYLYGDDKGPSHAVIPADLIYRHSIASTAMNQQYKVVSTAKSLTNQSKYQCCI